MKKIIIGSIILIIAIVVACSVAKKNELDNKVKFFLSEFQSKLNASDEEILKFFQTKQNKDEILKAIAILQNKDTAFVRVKVSFEEATANWENLFLKVEVPLDIIGSDKEIHRDKFFMHLFQKDGRYYIGRLEADGMYKQYMTVKNSDEGALARRMADVKIYYDKAKELQKNYDSVIWYTHHKNMTYYYAVKGSFNFDSLKKGVKQDYKMGLLDETGKVIVPAEFELIGNPSINLKGAVEVKRNGKIGYYSLEGNEIVPAVYDWLIPYGENDAIALAKKDSVYGWLDKSYSYHQNFPSTKAEQCVKEFRYLTENTFSFGAEYNELIKILYPFSEEFQYRAEGMVIPPSYFVTIGLFPQVDEGFIIKSFDSLRGFQYGTDFTETKSQKPFSISEKMDALISDFKSRFVGGREEFYTSHRIVLLDKKSNPITSVYADGDKDFEFRRLREDLFESKAQFNYWGPNEFLEANISYYNYFRFDGNKLTPIEINRVFDFTQIIKIDSSHLSGNFDTYDYVNNVRGKSNFLSLQTLQYMRDEILACYGFVFLDQEKDQLFKYLRKDLPETTSYDEVYSKASEIDKYNLDFLNKLIGSTPGGKSI